MPIGAFKLNGIGKFTVTAVAQVLRAKKGISAVGNAQVSTAQSKFGNSSALFDASADWLTATHTGDLNFGSSDFTVEFWMRPVTRATSYPQVYQNAAFGTGAINISDRHNYNTSKLQVWVVNALPADPILQSTTTIANNTWYHIAVVRSGSSWKLFVNGTSEATYTYAGNATSGTTSTVTAFANDIANSTVTQWNGYLDEIRISNTARYSSNFTAPTAPFVNDANTLLLLHCDGNNAATFFDDDNGTGRSAKGFWAQGNAQISTAQSKFGGSSAAFDGTADGIQINPITEMAWGSSNNFTYECWARWTTVTTSYIFDQRSTTNDLSPTLFYETNALKYYCNGYRISYTWTPTTNTWYHIALVRNSGTTVLYVDGVNRGSFADTINYVLSNTSLFIGSSMSVNTTINGYIDEFRVSNTARYTTGFTPSTTPFVNDANTLLLLHCDGTNATTVFRDDNGVGRSARGIQALGNAQVSTAQSKFGGSSALFDGTGDYLQTSIAALGSGDFTVECWANANSGFTNRGILHLGATLFPANTTGLAFAFENTGSNGVTFYRSGSSIATSTARTAGVWYHIAISRSGTTTKCFVDGTEVNSLTDTTNYTQTELAIGGYYNTSYLWNGYIDEVRISNSARYTANFTPSTTPFQNDSNTLLLIHAHGTNASTIFVDDNGVYPA